MIFMTIVNCVDLITNVFVDDFAELADFDFGVKVPFVLDVFVITLVAILTPWQLVIFGAQSKFVWLKIKSWS